MNSSSLGGRLYSPTVRALRHHGRLNLLGFNRPSPACGTIDIRPQIQSPGTPPTSRGTYTELGVGDRAAAAAERFRRGLLGV